MKIVRIADLSEEERKKALQKQEERFQKNEEERQIEIKRVNKLVEEQKIQEKMDRVHKVKQEDNRKWFESGAFKDGYQFGDVTKTLLGTGTDLYQDVTKGILGIGEGFLDTGVFIGQGIHKLTGNEQGVQRSKEFIERNLVEESDIANRIANNSILGMANNLVNGKITNQFNFTDYNKVKETMSSDEFEKGSVLGDKSDSLVQSGGQLLGTLGLQAIGVPWWVTTGVTSFGGGVEQAYKNNATYGEAGIYGLINVGAEVLTEKLSGGISFGGKTLDDVWLKPLTDKIANKTVQTLAKFGLDVVGEGFEEVVTEVIQNVGQKLTYEDEKTWQEILASPEALDKYLESFIGGTVLGGGANTIRLGKSLKNNVSYDTGLSNNTNILPTVQTIQEQNKLTQNSVSEQTEGILNNKELPMQSYQYELSNNAKINNLRQDANRYFNNSEKARNYVSMLEKIITDKDIEIRLDGNLKTADGRIANGSYYNGVITINPNSTRAGEFIAIHELTHAIGTKEMLNMINTYRNSNAEFDTAVKGLLKNYKGTEITEEALSDVAGQLFGNQEFINNIAQNNPNIFQKLYSEIKYLWHQFRGYKNQNQFVEDLYYKWTQAYKNNNSNIVKNNEILYNGNERESDIYDTTGSNTKYENPRMETENERVDTRSEYEIRSIEEEKYYESNRKEVEQSIKDEIKRNFNFKDDVINEIYNNVSKDEITEQDIYDAFDKHREITMSEPSQQIKDNIQAINKILRNTRLDVSYIKNDIADWNDIRKGQLGKFRLANDGMGVDTLYEELLELFPGYFDENITNPTEQLLTLIEWRNVTEEELLKPETYRLTDEDLNEIKNFILNSKEYLKSIKNMDFTENNTLNTNNIKYSIQESENNSGSFNLPKLKEGYTRLYRGLENKYDANYDKNKLDNSNGYESWTDNYELAKAYGNNVYYIDIPTSEIKNSIIDEDSTSETYGDRNLIYTNDKPIGIKGKSGNEYMLYTDHDNYGNIKYNSIDNNTSMQDNQGRTLTKEQQEFFKDSKVRDEKGNLLTMYHGTPNGSHNVFKNGGYFTSRKEYADGYQNTWASAISTKQDNSNPRTYEVYLNIKNPFTLSNPKAKDIYINEYIKGGNSLYYDPYTDWTNDINNLDEIDWTEGEDLKEWIQENHSEYDGLVLDEGGDGGYGEAEYSWRGKSYVPFNSNQIKNVDNSNPTSNPDIRYSQNNQTWQQYLDKNFKSTGTRTSMQDVLPTAKNNTQNVAPTVKDNVLPTTESNLEKYNKYKKNILDSRAKEVNNLITYKNETIRNIENKIAEKQSLLNSKKDKNTKTANILRTQIENLKTRQQRIENLYNEKIDKANSRTNRDKINFETRNMIKKEARENLRVEISPLTEDLTKYKDKKAGILYKRETAQRNIDDIVKDKELAQAIKETIFNPVQVHQAQKTREINKLFDRINSLDLDKTKKYNYVVEDNAINGEITEAKKNIKIDEATLAQLLIEKKITDTDLINKYNMSNNQINKIHKTADTFTEILDYLYNKMNEEQIKYGYSPIGKLNNYFPHFFENKPDTMLGKIASYFGIDITNQNLPTEIAGRTDIFKPGKTWNSNTLQRKTNKTDYDALKAMEKYIQGATDIIYTTEDIQKIREYERQIRYKYSDKGIQEEIDKIMNDKELTQEAKDKQIESVFKDTENELSNFVTWLNDYGNTLANKKSFSDRSMERDIGRNLYSSMSGIEARIASNTIGGNLSVSLTNFAPLFQASGTTKLGYLLTGMGQTTINNIKGIIGNKSFDFVDNSNFLTNRFGTDSIAQKTVTQKISDVASIPMNVIDEFTAESIVRGKYLENINKGMTEEQALDNADKYTAKVMADRSKGSLPLIFNAKNPISKLTTMFQVEPNNIISNYLKDMPRDASNKVELTKQVTKLMVASYAFNTLVMAIRGGNEVLPDPIRWVSYLIKAITGDDDEKEQAKTDLVESIIGNIPFTSNVAGLFGLEDIGRVPISNAMPNLANVVKVFDDEADSKYKKEIAIKEILKPLIYLGLPTGGAQIKKTIEGISTVSAGGSYKTDKKGNRILQFPVENATAKEYIQGGIFGKYSLPTSKEYAERGYKSLNAKQTKMYEDSKLPYNELTNYIDAGLTKKEDKINYINQREWTEQQKWGIYINDIFSTSEREKDGGSQLSDANYITSNGVSKTEYIDLYNKTQKNDIDMPTETEYKEIKSTGINLKTYVDYKINTKGMKKDSEKIQTIIDSKYTNKEKQNLYENYIKNSTDEKYDIIKSVNNFNINSYLEYKLASINDEFKADRKDDGTVSGKAISGSAKDKKYNYIINMKNTPYMQKVIMFGLENTPSKTDKSTIVNYISSLPGKTNKEKLEILDEFSWVTIYKNGTIKY